MTTAAVIGDVRQVSRFPSRDHFAAYNGTAPIEVSSGGRKVYRLSRHGNRRLNHTIHMIAVTQIRYRHSPGRGYYDKKPAEGKTGKAAPTVHILRNLAIALHASARMRSCSTPASAAPPATSPCAWKPVSRLDDNEKAAVLALIESMLLRHEARRLTPPRAAAQ